MYEILIESDSSWSRGLRLPAGEHVIGRDGDVSIQIDDPSISRHHARICIDNDGLWVEDLGSANGSFIDGVAVDGAARAAWGQPMVFGNITLTATPAGESENEGAPYARGEVVAHGGMGAILGARQVSMDREVAMKVMLRDGDEAAVQRFIHEARITGKLEHPNIVPVHELGTDEDGRVFYTMKFVRGITLAQLLERARAAPLAHPLASLLTVFQKVCDAVGFAHSRGVIHRDLKPENIMLGDYGEVLVMDWGLAKELGNSGEEEMTDAPVPDGGAGSTLDGSVLGTPAYMSPEQARGEVAAMDARSDIYALGAILHEILYLRPLVTGANPLEIIVKVGAGQVDRIGRFRSKHLPETIVPASLRAVRRKALAFDPQARYATVGALQADIAAYQSGFATTAEGAGVMTRAELFFKRHRGVSRAVVTAAIAVVALSVWFVLNVMHERNRAERARIAAERALALVEPARIEATAQRDRATAALADAEAQRVFAETQRATAAAERDRALKALAETREIRKRANDALREMQNAGEIFSRLTVEYVRAGKVEEALENIDRALEAAPQENRYRVARANLLQASGRFAQAIPEYRRALAVQPDPEVERNLALTEKLLREQGGDSELSANIRRQLQEALEAQNRALEAILLDAALEDAIDPLADLENYPDPFDTELKDTPPEPPIEDPPVEDPPPPPDPRAEIAAMLGSLVMRQEWNLDRITLHPDGTFKLDLSGMILPDLSVLKNTKVTELVLNHTRITELTALRGLQLHALHLLGTLVEDLSPLSDMPLRYLNIHGTRVTDISPLRGTPLVHLDAHHTRLESLDPLVGLPLTHLMLYPNPLSDYSAIPKLVHLEVLGLPPHAHGIDFTPLTKLKQVSHNRFNPQTHGWMPAADFIPLSHMSDRVWNNLRRTLERMDAENLTPDRLTVLVPDTFDLDLRGTRVTNLKPLAGLPIHRLYLDTDHEDLDLAPLANMPTLKHLVVSGARIPELRACFPGSKLETIVIDPLTSMEDLVLLEKHPVLRRIGYTFHDTTREPHTSKEEFFHPRVVEPSDEVFPEQAKPLARHRFDGPQVDLAGWKVVTEDGKETSFTWLADPTRSGGRGGATLAAFGARGDSKTSYFKAPESLRGNREMLYGGCMEFQIRLEHNYSCPEASDVMLVSGNKRLVHSFADKPSAAWRGYQLPFDESGGWHVDEVDGEPATAREIRDVLRRLDAILIRAEFTDDLHSPDPFHTGNQAAAHLDDFTLWAPRETPWRKRIAEAARIKFEESIRWGELVGVLGGSAADYILDRNNPLTVRGSKVWVPGFAGREGCMIVHPVSQAEPARITFPTDKAILEGTMLEFSAHASRHRPGVVVRITHRGEIIHEAAVENAWQDFDVALPPDARLADCTIEIHPVGWTYEYCLLSEIRIVSPAD